MARVPRKDVFSFTWHIENFSMCPLKKGECLLSPAFVVDSLDQTRWNLSVYPREVLDGVNYLSCYLKRIDEDEPEKISIDFIITVNSDEELCSDSFKHVVYEENSFFGCKLYSGENISEKFFPDDILTLECCMWRASDKKANEQSTSQPEHPTSGPAVIPGTASYPSAEEMYSVLSDEGTVTTDGLHRPIRCSFHTRIPVERRRVTWTIKNFNPQSKQRIPVSVVSAMREKSGLLLTCYVTGNAEADGGVVIDIQRKDIDFKQTLVRCKIAVLDRNGIAQEHRKDECLFGDDYKVWSLPLIQLSTLRHHNLLYNDELSLRCEFFVSHEGEEVTMGGTSLRSRNSIDTGEPNEKLQILLEEYDHTTDVILTLKDYTLRVHKAVICAQSPVFGDLFRGDAQGDQTNVNIVDMDKKIVDSIVDFMYGFPLTESRINSLKLYSAAYKYQILTLKKRCANSLKYNLSLINACEVLELADSHQDADLINYVENFLCIHAKDVFRSREWEKLMDDNFHLAGATMHRVLKKITNS